MKFVCEGLLLSDAAIVVSKACSTKSLTPALECIKLSAQNDVVTLVAYDGEISIEKKIKAEVIEEGETLVNGKFLAEFVAKIADKPITIVTGEKGMEIRYDDSRSFMAVLPASDFPQIRKDETDKSFTVKESDFKTLIAKTVFCCATDDSRPILKGCLLEAKDGKLCATALDGFRMAVSYCDYQGGEESKIVCPARTLTEISRMMEGQDKELEIRFSKNTLSVKLEDTVLISRLYTGEFINKANIYPPEFDTVFTVSKQDILWSAERAAVLIRGDKNNLILMEIKNVGALISANSDLGHVSETVKGELTGKEIKIAMNGKFVIDALKALDGEKVKLSFNTPVSPFTIEGIEEKDSSYLILPVRTNS